MRFYALVCSECETAVELYPTRPAADAALEDALRDEPGWSGSLRVEPIDLDGSAGAVSPAN